MAVVATGQCLPQAPGVGGAAPAQYPGHDAPAGALDGQPEPHFAPPAAHERPHFIQFQGFPLPALGLFWPQARQGRAGHLRFFCQLGHRHARHAGHAHDAALGIALHQQLFHLRITHGPRNGGGRKAGLVATRRALVLGVALAVAVAPDVLTAARGAYMLR